MRRGRAAKEQRQREAKERQAARDKRSDEAQLEKLIANGHGHCREATRIADGIGRDERYPDTEGEA